MRIRVGLLPGIIAAYAAWLVWQVAPMLWQDAAAIWNVLTH